jgi:hypothetical protein
MTHLAMGEVDNQGDGAAWGKHVSDPDYRVNRRHKHARNSYVRSW